MEELTFGQKAVGITDLSCDDEVFQSLLSFSIEIDRIHQIMMSSNKYTRIKLCSRAIRDIKNAAESAKIAITD